MPLQIPAKTIRLHPTSRYRNTRVYSDTKSSDDPTTVVFFGTWRPPRIVETRPPIQHWVAPDEIHRPDLISFRVYGNPELFWAIAMRNNWMLPIADIQVGRMLLCPHLDDIQQALNSSFSTNPGTQ